MDKFYVKFNGGLGNQMFQYAFAKSIGDKFNLVPFFDMSFFKQRYARPFELGIFDIKIDENISFLDKLKMFLLWKFRKHFNNKTFGGLRLVREPHFEYFNFNIQKNDYVEGFFQSEKYFINYDIKKDFIFKDDLDGKNLEVANLIKSSNSISLHIRRGDYVKKKRYQNMFAHCSLDYYRNAVDIIAKGDTSYKLFIFSDDIQWVKENLNLPYETFYVDFNSGKDSYKDMQLMSLCKHNVIANSSFSWWGAYLNNNPEKIVVAPKLWFNDKDINQSDVIPQNWIRIDNV